jgi:hypothetical protein
MTNHDDHRADARSGKAAGSAERGAHGKPDHDAAAKAVLDNMARLRALRLAREAAEPQAAAPAKAKRAKAATAKTSGKKEDPKHRALSEWLAEQQSGGRRT